MLTSEDSGTSCLSLSEEAQTLIPKEEEGENLPSGMSFKKHMLIYFLILYVQLHRQLPM